MISAMGEWGGLRWNIPGKYDRIDVPDSFTVLVKSREYRRKKWRQWEWQTETDKEKEAS